MARAAFRLLEKEKQQGLSRQSGQTGQETEARVALEEEIKSGEQEAAVPKVKNF